MTAATSTELPTSPTSPLAPFPPLPPSEFRSRAPEFYGFVAWTSTYLLFVLYLLWALLPDEWILWLAVDWYPNREWALLVPAWLCVVVLLTYFTYFAMALYGTPSFDDLRTITDSKALYPGTVSSASSHFVNHEGSTVYARFAASDAIPEAYDIPIGILNDVMYSTRGRARRQGREASAASTNSAESVSS